MTEKLGEIGDVLSGISNAVKTMKLLQGKNADLSRVTEETKIRASEVEELNLPDEPLLKELKLELGKVRDSGSELEVWLRTFGKEIEEFEKFVRAKVRGSIPREVIREFCEKLNNVHNMASNFSAAFNAFIDYLSKSQQLATKLSDRLKQKAEEMEQQANSTINWGVAKTVGLAIGGVGFAALGFFTFGATWPAAAACVVGASVVAINTVVNVVEMRELARGIVDNSKKLDAIAKELKSSCDRAGTIQLDQGAMKALQTALEFYSKDLEKDDCIALQQEKIHEQTAKIDEQEAKIAEMEAKMRAHGIH